ncbi:hypothetical protein [Streptomyces sp. NPDC059753]|uniref:hypothetical protein n=1 Tax=Streptomyces sp. NPDC059753 TaxID=3346933 RepID=UPI003647FA36
MAQGARADWRSAPAAELAESYGTPALILDVASVRARARRFADGLAARWPNSRAAFASKAFPCTARHRRRLAEPSRCTGRER